MAGLKITPTSAMRARDVSRPRPEHLAAAAEREETVSRYGDRTADAVTPSAITRTAGSRKTVPANPAPPGPEASSAGGEEAPDAAQPGPAQPAGVIVPIVRPAGGEPVTARRRRRGGR